MNNIVYMGKNKRLSACLVALLVFACGMTLAAFFDLKLSAWLTHLTTEPLTITVPNFTMAFEIIGEWPALLMGGFAAAIIMRAFLQMKKPIGYIGAVCSAAVLLCVIYFAAHGSFEDVKEDLGTVEKIISIAMTLVISAAIFFAVMKLPEKKAKGFLVPSIVCIAVLGCVMVGAQGLKIIWGRVRLKEMVLAGDTSLFTPWYRPNLFSGHHSFPSGHMVNASSLGLLPLFYSRSFCKRFPNAKKITYTVVVFWNALMAFTRLLAGAHFLSDVLCGAFIGFAAVIVADIIMQKISEA